MLRRAADPFIYNIDGTVVAHGANPSIIGRTLPNIIADSIVLGGFVDGAALNTQFVEAAFNGGGWVGNAAYRDALHHDTGTNEIRPPSLPHPEGFW